VPSLTSSRIQSHSSKSIPIWETKAKTLIIRGNRETSTL